MSQFAELLVEVGCEEIPARMTRSGAEALRDALIAEIDAQQVAYGAVQIAYTPRRLTVIIENLQLRQDDREEEVTGPPAAAAFRDGKPTPAAIGFARSRGVEVSALRVVETAKGPYVGTTIHIAGRDTRELLSDALPRCIGAIPWPKTMRWGAGRLAFVRPVHWLLALLGGEVVPFEFAGIAASSTTEGHRFKARGPFEVTDAKSYREALDAAYVRLDPAARRLQVLAEVAALQASAQGTAIDDEGLIDEITNLVEYPVASLGTFDRAYLELPEEVLIAAMRNHQRYVALRGADGNLLNQFIVVSNTPAKDQSVVTRGNQRVIAARLADARFFWNEDLKKPLATHAESLGNRIFLRGLGSVADKASRIAALAGWLADRVDPEAKPAAVRAAQMCKADLGTLMVGEFPELQGVMGGYYAQRAELGDDVATAIREHYQPRFAGDALPSTAAAAIVSVADKMDSLVGCFGIGLKPSGTQDPYALRRGVLGVLHILEARGWRLPLRDILSAAADHFVGSGTGQLTVPREDAIDAALEFVLGRLRHYAAQSMPVDAVEAVLSTGDDIVPDLSAKMRALSAIRSQPDFEPLAIAFKRVSNITKDLRAAPVDVSDADLQLAEETALWVATKRQGEQSRAHLEALDFEAALRALVAVKGEVDAFFDGVLVMDPDDAVRARRLSLLVAVRELFAPFADFSRIQT